MKERDIERAIEMIERRNKLIHQIEQLRDSVPTSLSGKKGKKMAAQLHFSNGTISVGVTQNVFDLIVISIEDQIEYINNQLKGMGITTLDEEIDAEAKALAKRTSVPVTREPRSFSGMDIAPTPIIPSVSDPDREPPRHPDDDFGGEP